MPGSTLQWSAQAEDAGIVARPVGVVDEATANAFADHLIAAVETAGGADARLVIDMSGLSYMSSRGLRALTLAQRKANELKVAIALAGPNEAMLEILAISRYDKLFGVYESLSAVPKQDSPQ
jgi:anti-sigma B factor antagonist